MSLLSRVRDVLAQWRVRPSAPDRRGPFVPLNLAGVPVTPDTALTLAVVFRCVSLIAQDIASLPWHAGRHVGNTRERDESAEWLLAHEANPELGAMAFRETIIGHALLWGNGYAEIVRNGRGQAVELWPLTPDRVTPKRSLAGALYYEVTPAEGGPLVEMSPRDVFHIRGLGWDGIRGYSVVWNAARTLGVHLALDEMAAAYFRNGAKPGLAIEVPVTMSPEALKAQLEMIRARYSGPSNAAAPIVLDNGTKLHTLSIPNNEAQFLESRKFQVEEVCRWFGVPPHKALHLDRATWNNIEHQALDYVQSALLPWCRRLEEEATRKLLFAYPATYSKLMLQGLMRGDTSSRVSYYREMRALGVLSVNEIRALEDLDPIGPDGDVRVMQAQYVPLDRLGESAGRLPLDPGPGEAAPEEAEETEE